MGEAMQVVMRLSAHLASEGLRHGGPRVELPVWATATLGGRSARLPQEFR